MMLDRVKYKDDIEGLGSLAVPYNPKLDGASSEST
jgi:hypothetical protein